MSQTEKAELYQELKNAGATFEKHYREYSTEELQAAVTQLRLQQAAAPAPAPEPQAKSEPSPADIPPLGLPPRAHRDESEMPGVRLNRQDEFEPIRTDPETGFVWYQEEVQKPAFPKPRGRRVLQYRDTGTKLETAQNGDYVESFEVSGDEVARSSEIKITLPSYQVGIYRDPRFPFRIHVYNERRGFDLFEVQNFYGGADLVPTEIKRVYVENVLCYDIRTTVRAIQTEYRQLQLAGRVK